MKRKISILLVLVTIFTLNTGCFGNQVADKELPTKKSVEVRV